MRAPKPALVGAAILAKSKMATTRYLILLQLQPKSHRIVNKDTFGRFLTSRISNLHSVFTYNDWFIGLKHVLYVLYATFFAHFCQPWDHIKLNTALTRQSEMANISPRHMPVLGNVHPIKIRKLWYFFVTSFLCSLEFLYF